MDGLFATYLSLCRQFQFPPPWDCLRPDPEAFLGPSSPTDAARGLNNAPFRG